MKCVIEFPNGHLGYIEIDDTEEDLWKCIEKYDQEHGTELFRFLDNEDFIEPCGEKTPYIYKASPMTEEDYASLQERFNSYEPETTPCMSEVRELLEFCEMLEYNPPKNLYEVSECVESLKGHIHYVQGIKEDLIELLSQYQNVLKKHVGDDE